MKPDTTMLRQAKNIMLQCEDEILSKTGYKIKLSMSTATLDVIKAEELMFVISESLSLTMDDYDKQSRRDDRVLLRFVTTLILRKYYPLISFRQIGELYGGQDHSSVAYGLFTGTGWLEVGDDKFTSRYNVALKAVEKFLNQHEETNI